MIQKENKKNRKMFIVADSVPLMKVESIAECSEHSTKHAPSLSYHLSRGMGFPTIWYVRPAKPHISLRILAV